MEFRTLIISALLVGLFVVAMTMGFNQLASQNNAQNPFGANSLVQNASDSLQTDLNEISTTINDTRNNFATEKTNLLTGFLLFGSILEGAKQLINVIVTVFQTTFDTITIQLGIPPVVMGVFTAIILISLVLLAWKLVKGGE